MTTPRLGDIVIYRSRTGDYSLAAIVTATRASINPLGVERGQVPELTGDDHVHLAVFTPGLPAASTPATTYVPIDPDRPLGDRVVPPDAVADAGPNVFLACTAFGGSYAEFDIPEWAGLHGNETLRYVTEATLRHQAPGTWARRAQ